MSKNPKCNSDYSNLISYSQGVTAPIKAPVVSSLKSNLLFHQIPPKSGYQSLKSAYLPYPTTCSKVLRSCCN